MIVELILTKNVNFAKQSSQYQTLIKGKNGLESLGEVQ